MGEDRGAGPAGDGRTDEEIDEAFEEAFRKLAELRGSRPNPQGRDAVAEQVLNAGTREEIEEAKKAMRAWMEEHPEDRTYLRRNAGAMALTESLLDAEERRMRDPAYRELQKLRQPLVERAMAAETQEEIDEAMRAINAWLREHPEDEAVLDSSTENLLLREQYIELREEGIDVPREEQMGRGPGGR